MSNPSNKFGNFFNDPTPVMGTIKPKPEQILEALYLIMVVEAEWYKRGDLRMVVVTTLQNLAQVVKENQEKTGKNLLSPAEAAFCCVLADLATATRDEYATDEEKEKFPILDDDEETDEDED
jgi:hypothetical protein